VDDEPAIREILTEALLAEGYEVRVAAHGAEALELVQASPPAAIVLDLMMPVMDGWTFRARHLELDGAAEVPVVVLSAAHDAARQAQMLGAAAVISKPFDLEAVLGTLDGLLAAPGP
jgi:CheY-like chemotaxis protein